MEDGAETRVSEVLKGYLSARFPEWRDLALLHLLRTGVGLENEVYSFRLERLEAGSRVAEDLILRVYQGEGAEEKSVREFGTMKKLREADFPVPRVCLLERDPGLLGGPFVVMEKVEGRIMAEVFSESSWLRRNSLLDTFCRTLVQLHSLDPGLFAEDPEVSGAGNPQLAMLDKISRTQELFRSLGKSEFDPVFDWLRRRAASVSFERPSLVHWDYHPWNIILTSEGKPFVIDWTQAELLDFRFDLGWTTVLVATHASPLLGRAVLRRYGRISGKRIGEMDFFEVAACLKRLFAVSVSLTHGPERIGMRAGTEAALKEHSRPLKRVYAILRKRTGISIPDLEVMLSRL